MKRSLRFSVLFTIALVAFLSVPPTGYAADPKASLTNDLSMTFVWIPAGSFIMGSPEDEPERNLDETQHQVTLTQGFYIQTTEVTQAQWTAVMGRNPSRFPPCGPDCPVESVSWEMCQEFIRELSAWDPDHTYRLPTEAEWEYACRAGTPTSFSMGPCMDTTMANYNGNYFISGCTEEGVYRKNPMPVKSFSPNPWGLYDMHGNVGEWCQDRYGEYPKGPVTDPQGPDEGTFRVFRGGSWYSNPATCRSANREEGNPQGRYHSKGLRLICE
ncbi:MAG: formylglycine-generating enzyme family protein [Desulfobacteraceae bacterium]|jgi:formylglycine-generating enzyme required for sulfatase activity